jgi:hypothetical protein
MTHAAWALRTWAKMWAAGRLGSRWMSPDTPGSLRTYCRPPSAWDPAQPGGVRVTISNLMRAPDGPGRVRHVQLASDV